MSYMKKWRKLGSKRLGPKGRLRDCLFHGMGQTAKSASEVVFLVCQTDETYIETNQNYLLLRKRNRALIKERPSPATYWAIPIVLRTIVPVVCVSSNLLTQAPVPRISRLLTR